jgi:hypothetical protein
LVAEEGDDTELVKLVASIFFSDLRDVDLPEEWPASSFARSPSISRLTRPNGSGFGDILADEVDSSSLAIAPHVSALDLSPLSRFFSLPRGDFGSSFSLLFAKL